MRAVTIGNYYPKAILSALESNHINLDEALQSAGLTARTLHATNTRINPSQYVALVRKARELMQDESFGYLPTPLKPGTFDMACEFMMNAETIEEALQKFCRFLHVATNDIIVDLSLHKDEAIFSISLKDPERDKWHYILDTILYTAYNVPIWLSKQRVILKRAGFSYAKPPHADEYQFLFPCDRLFNFDGNTHLVIDRRSLQLPVIRTPIEIKQYLKNTSLNFLGAAINNWSVSNRVYNELSSEDYFDMPDCQDVAKKFNMSEQTLRRKLKAEGTSFQEIKDNLRRDIAIYHLSRGNQKVAAIGDRLGFSTPGAFSRAFKQWMGVPPELYRNKYISA